MATYNGHQEDASGNLLLPTPHSLADNVELGSTASQAYTEGTFLVFNNRLCRATKAIAKNNTLAIGTNLETTSVGAQISDLRNKLDGVRDVYWRGSNFLTTNAGTFSANSYIRRAGIASMYIEITLNKTVLGATDFLFYPDDIQFLPGEHTSIPAYIESGTNAGTWVVLYNWGYSIKCSHKLYSGNKLKATWVYVDQSYNIDGSKVINI